LIFTFGHFDPVSDKNQVLEKSESLK